MKKIILTVCAFSLLFSQTGCFGSFGLTTGLYQWNDSVASNKFVKSLLFVALVIIPVYEIAAFVDIVVLNLIEFWSGSNPTAMNEGDIEEQIVTYKGEEYKITATKNQFSFAKLNGKEEIKLGAIKLENNATSWSFVKEGKKVNLFEIKNDNTVDFATVDGVINFNQVQIDELISSESNFALK